jgi:hypothetical protein
MLGISLSAGTIVAIIFGVIKVATDINTYLSNTSKNARKEELFQEKLFLQSCKSMLKLPPKERAAHFTHEQIQNCLEAMKERIGGQQKKKS